MGWTFALTAIGAAFSAGAAASTGRSQARGFEHESSALRQQAEQDEIDAEWVEVQTEQHKAVAEDELTKVLAYNVVSAGYDPFASMSFLAVESANRDATRRDVDRIELEGRSQMAKSFRNQTENIIAAGHKTDQASMAIRAGRVNAVRTLFSGGAKLAQIA